MASYVVRIEFHVEAFDEEDAETEVEGFVETAKDHILCSDSILNFEIRETVRYRGRKKNA